MRSRGEIFAATDIAARIRKGEVTASVYPCQVVPPGYLRKTIYVKPVGQGFRYTDGYRSTPTFFCPAGIVNDVLAVRETWRLGGWDASEHAVRVDIPGRPGTDWVYLPEDEFDKYVNRSRKYLQRQAPAVHEWEMSPWGVGESPLPWRNAPTMPTWACKTFVKLKSVHLVRAFDITPEMMLAAGARQYNHGYQICRDTEAAEDFSEAMRLWWGRRFKKSFYDKNPFAFYVTFSLLDGYTPLLVNGKPVEWHRRDASTDPCTLFRGRARKYA